MFVFCLFYQFPLIFTFNPRIQNFLFWKLSLILHGGGGVVPIGYQDMIDIVVRGYDDIIFAPKQLMVPPVLGLGLELGLTLTLPPLRWHTIGIKLFHSLIHQRRIGTHCKQETLCRSWNDVIITSFTQCQSCSSSYGLKASLPYKIRLNFKNSEFLKLKF